MDLSNDLGLRPRDPGPEPWRAHDGAHRQEESALDDRSVRGVAERVTEAVARRMYDPGHPAGEAVDEILDELAPAAVDWRRWLRRRPYLVLAGVAAAGFLAGRLRGALIAAGVAAGLSRVARRRLAEIAGAPQDGEPDEQGGGAAFEAPGEVRP